MWAERRTSLTGETADVETVALWVHLDPDTLRPAPFAPGELDAYTAASGGREVRARLRHDRPPRDAPREPWHFRATDLDLAGHVNNAAYWCLVEERLLGAAPEAIDAEIEVRSAAPPGDASVQERGERLWVTGADGELNASMVTRRGA
jgi:acyl-ACP thioesterase